MTKKGKGNLSEGGYQLERVGHMAGHFQFGGDAVLDFGSFGIELEGFALAYD